MRLAEMLSYADIGQLHQLADAYSCQCNTNSKNELIQSLLLSIQREAVIHEQLSSLRREELHFLMHLVFDTRTTFTLEDLRAKAKYSYLEDLEKDTYRSLVSVALKKGWIFRVDQRSLGAAFQIPEDMRKQWMDAILKNEIKNEWRLEAPSIYRDEGFAMTQDIRSFLRYIGLHEPPLTGEGTIYRRNQQQIYELMAVREQPVEKGGWRFGYGRHFRDYPDRFSLIYDFCFYRKYINEESGARLLLSPLAEEAFQLPDDLLAFELFKFWIRLYKRPIPGLSMLVRMTGEAGLRGWVEETSLLHMLSSRIRPYYYDTAENIAANRILKMMIHLGLIRRGTTNEQEAAQNRVCQTSEWGTKALSALEDWTMKTIILDKEKSG